MTTTIKLLPPSLSLKSLAGFHFLFIVFILSAPLITEAAEVPNFYRDVSITAREQPVNDFLVELFSQIGVPVTIDSELEGLVNGAFADVSAQQVFSEISRSFGQFMVYYDGAVAHVYTSKEVSQRMLTAPASVVKSLISTVQELNMTDEINRLRPMRAGGLVVTGSKRFVEQVEKLLFAAQGRLVDNEPTAGFEVFYLKYAWAQDVTLTFGGRQIVVPGVASILRSLIEDQPRLTSQSVSSDKLTRPTQSSLRGQGLAGVGGVDGKAGDPTADARNIGGKQASNEPQLFEAQAVRTNEVSVKNRVRIDADTRLNAIIIRDVPEKMVRYRKLIETLDIKPEMLEVEATIIDINTSRLRELGINWRWQNGSKEVLFGDGSVSDQQLRPGEVITPQGMGGFASFVLGDNAKFIGRINALESEGAAEVVSRPRVLTLSNVEAIFNTGETFYVRVEGREEVDLFNVSVGTSLRVTPHVFDEAGQTKIKLLITIEDGQKRGQEVVDRIPIIDNSVINTQALINAGESILIGGLRREETIEVEDKVPLLGDIPLLGRLFKRKKNETVAKERLFLISPKLASNGEATQQGQKGFKPFLDSGLPGGEKPVKTPPSKAENGHLQAEQRLKKGAEEIPTATDAAQQSQDQGGQWLKPLVDSAKGEKPVETRPSEVKSDEPSANTPESSWEYLLDY